MVLSPSISNAQEDEKPISIFLGWSDQFQFAGYYAAVEKGFYEEEGLNVVLISGANANGVEKVLRGEFEFGTAPGALLLSSRNYNQTSVLAAIFQQSPISLLTLRKNKINTLKDLEGKTISGGSEVRAMLMSAGVDLSKVKFKGISTNFRNLINGSFDGV